MHERVAVNGLSLGIPSLEAMERLCAELKPRRISLVSQQVTTDGEAAALAMLRRNGWRLETITHPFRLGPLSPDERTWETSRAQLSRMISFAKQAGARSIYMITGGRGRASWQEAADIFCAAVAPCAEEARQAGVALLIEPAPFFHAAVHLTHTLRDTVALAKMAGIGVCIDVFSCWTEPELKSTITGAMPICGLVQIGDYVCGDSSFPARAVPGDGDIPIREICSWILSDGYLGGFDLELIGPRINDEGFVPACARAAEYVGKLIDELAPARV